MLAGMRDRMGYRKAQKFDRHQEKKYIDYDSKIYFRVFEVEEGIFQNDYLLFYEADGRFLSLEEIKPFLTTSRMQEVVSAKKGYIGFKGTTKRVEPLSVARKPSPYADLLSAICPELNFDRLQKEGQQGYFSFLMG